MTTNGARSGKTRSFRTALARCIVLVCTVVPLASRVPPAVAASPRPVRIDPPRLGFSGRAKLNVWTPVEISIAGGDEKLTAQVDLSTPDGDGVQWRVPTGEGRPIQILPDQVTTFVGYVKLGRFDADLGVRLTSGSKVVAEEQFPLTADGNLGLESDQEWIVAVGQPIAIEIAPADANGLGRGETVQLNDAAQLPTRWFGYEGVDWLVLTTSRPDAYAALAGNSARQAALVQWVREGGKLLLCVGKEAPTIFRPGQPLAELAPGDFRELATLKNGGPLEAYAETSQRLDGSDGGLALQVPTFDNMRGVVEASAPGLPLVIRMPMGFGEVVFVGLDLDQPPLNHWVGARSLTNKLLSRSRPAKTAESQGAVYGLGYQDLSGQLRGGLDQFSGVQPVSFGLVALLILLYIALIGPGDYLFVKRVLKRMELTWITFPIWVIAFCGLAYGLAFWLKGDKLRVNQAEVVDIDISSGRARGAFWANIFSPRIDTYDLTLAPTLPSGSAPAAQSLVSWLGLPGRALAGRGGPGWFGSDYSAAPSLDALQAMPVGVWSTKGLQAHWSAPASAGIGGALGARGQASDLELTGTLINQLPTPLENCVLLHGRWAYPLGTLAPGQSITLDRRDPQTLETYFKRIHSDSGNVVMTRYDRAAADVAQTLEVMMFHQAIGGSAYTGLVNEHARSLDLSRHLQLGRAILLCQSPRGSQLLRDGQPLVGNNDQTWTYYRFLLPVQRQRATGADGS